MKNSDAEEINFHVEQIVLYVEEIITHMQNKLWLMQKNARSTPQRAAFSTSKTNCANI